MSASCVCQLHYWFLSLYIDGFSSTLWQVSLKDHYSMQNLTSRLMEKMTNYKRMGACPLARMHMLQNELRVVCCLCLFRSVLVLQPVIIARNSEHLVCLNVFACRPGNRWGSLWLSRPLMRADSPCQSLSPSSLMPRKCFCRPARRRMRYNTGLVEKRL